MFLLTDQLARGEVGEDERKRDINENIGDFLDVLNDSIDFLGMHVVVDCYDEH